MMTGEMTDISHISRRIIPLLHKMVQKVLRTSNINKGNTMSQNVVTEQGEILPIQTCKKLIKSKWENLIEIEKKKEINLYIS